MKNRKKIKPNGFTLVEIMTVSFLGVFLFSIFYQLTFGSLSVLLSIKRDTDNLETKAPSIELLDRYFDRWGIGGVTNSTLIPAVDGKRTEIQSHLRYLSIGDGVLDPLTDVKSITEGEGTSTSPISFQANLSGFAFVTQVSGGTASAIGCRLTSKIKSTATEGCYYILRDDKIIPSNLDKNDNEYTDFISLDVAYNGSQQTECVDGDFSSNVKNAPNMTITSNGIRDFESPTTKIADQSLEPGDVIFNAPHRVQLYIAENPNDKDIKTNLNNKWLYVRLQSISCGIDPTDDSHDSIEEAIAPADSIKAKLLESGTKKAVEITVDFRSTSRNIKGETKNFKITKIFGAQ